MIVILEGVERCGKTTIAKEFEKRGFIYFKDIVREKNYEINYMNSRYDTTLNFLIKLNEKRVNIVIDRFHISQIVNSMCFRSKTEKELSHYFYIDSFLSIISNLFKAIFKLIIYRSFNKY